MMDIVAKIKNKVRAHKIKSSEKKVAKEFYGEWLKKKQDNEIIVLLSGLIGDTIYAMTYMASFAKENHDKQISIYFEQKRKELIDAYMLPQNCHLKSINGDEESYRMGCFMRTKKYARLGLKNGIISTVPCFAFSGATLKSFRENIYHLKKSAEISRPNIPLYKVSSIPDFEKHKANIVILNQASAGAKGVIHKTDIFFESVAKTLIENGYEVYTNVLPEQKAVNGTHALHCSLFELYNICKEIPLFISVRSGITDLIVGTGVNMFVLYCTGTLYKYNIQWKKKFTLSEWKPIGSLYEYVPPYLHFVNSKWIEKLYTVFLRYAQENSILK